MNKEQIDEFYHLLRVASNIAGESATMVLGGKPMDFKTGLTPQEQVDVLYGLCQHLLAGGAYSALVKFSQYYGERFLVDPTFHAIGRKNWTFTRIVEFGAGLGWLGRMLAAKFGLLPALFVDKRAWVLIDVVADLETEEGRAKVLSRLKDGDLIVTADLLHCLDDPKEVMEPFSKWPMAVLEYCPVRTDYRVSYSTQISRYGAAPIDPELLQDIFSNRYVDAEDLDPYVLLLVEAAK